MKVQANCNKLVGLDETVKTQLFLSIYNFTYEISVLHAPSGYRKIIRCTSSYFDEQHTMH